MHILWKMLKLLCTFRRALSISYSLSHTLTQYTDNLYKFSQSPSCPLSLIQRSSISLPHSLSLIFSVTFSDRFHLILAYLPLPHTHTYTFALSIQFWLRFCRSSVPALQLLSNDLSLSLSLCVYNSVNTVWQNNNTKNVGKNPFDNIFAVCLLSLKYSLYK